MQQFDKAHESRSQKQKIWMEDGTKLCVLILIVIVAVSLSACGGGTGKISAPPPLRGYQLGGTYTLTVTGTSQG